MVKYRLQYQLLCCYTLVYIKSVVALVVMAISGHVVSFAIVLVVSQQETGTEKLLKTCS